jgi:hypothetical protein
MVDQNTGGTGKSRTTWWTTSRTTTRYLQPGTPKNAKVARDNQ